MPPDRRNIVVSSTQGNEIHISTWFSESEYGLCRAGSGNHLMKFFWYSAFAAIALSACVQVPQTSGDFRHAVQGGAFMTRTHSAVVSQPFDTVVVNLHKYALTCLARTHTSVVMSSSPGDMSTGMVIYRPKLQLVGPQSAELTLQMGPTSPGIKVPPDGPFIMLVDIESSSIQGETRLTVYGRTNSREQALADESLPAWASGIPAKCPLE